jgi:hypothetical protein
MHAAFALLLLTFAYDGGGGLEPEEYIAPPQCHRLSSSTAKRRDVVVDVGRRGPWDVIRSNAHSYLIPPASNDVLAIVDDAPSRLRHRRVSTTSDAFVVVNDRHHRR